MYVAGIDNGERWVLMNVVGKQMATRDGRGVHHIFQYDSLHREIEQRTYSDGDPNGQVAVKTVCGENQPQNLSHNLRGRILQIFDQCGLHENDRFDYLGHCVSSSFTPASLTSTPLSSIDSVRR